MGHQLTKQDMKMIRDEIKHRKLVVRKQALEEVKEARAHGDLSENFEYKAAKKFKNQNESRIRYLERLLRNAEVYEDHSAEDEVGMNNTVRVYFEDDDEEEVFKIVTTVRGDSLNNIISIESPIGKALLGHKTGERVYIPVRDGYGYYVRIVEVQKTNDESENIQRF